MVYKECLEKFNDFHFPQDEHFIFVLYLSNFYSFILSLLFLKIEKLWIWWKIKFYHRAYKTNSRYPPLFQAHTPEVNSFNCPCFGSSGGYIWKSKQYVYTILLAT